MSEIKEPNPLLAVRSNAWLCPACNGNDGDIPCAYPSEGVQGCWRDKRIKLMPLVRLALESQKSDTRSEKEKIDDAVAFITDTRFGGA